MSLQLVIFGALVMSTMAQRPSFAGSRPASGYKDGYIQPTSTNNNNNNIDGGAIGSRITDSSPARIPAINSIPNLPIDARGDAYLVNHYNSLPIDQRPYWLLNQYPIEAQRGIPPRRPADNAGIGSNQFNGGFNGLTQPIGNNPNLTPQQPGVVYPSNRTPQQQQQQTDLEIQYLQQLLNQLIQNRNQQQQQPNSGGQINHLGRFR